MQANVRNSRLLWAASLSVLAVVAGIVVLVMPARAQPPTAGAEPAARQPDLAPPTVQQGTPVAVVAQPPAHETAREIVVYFSRHPESDDDLTAVFPVVRTAPDAGVAKAALEALIAGPTPSESAAGYFSELGRMLVGPSQCGGADFTIRIERGLATVRFCRLVSSAGIGQDARVHSALEATLRQFATIQQVRLLTPEGDCLFDMSGENRCLAHP